jgi:nitrate/nitrite transporter NarK
MKSRGATVSGSYVRHTCTNTHGHASGVIGAVGDNGIGVAGVAWPGSAVHMIGCKFLADDAEGSVANAVECVRWCRYVCFMAGARALLSAVCVAIACKDSASIRLLFVVCVGDPVGKVAVVFKSGR